MADICLTVKSQLAARICFRYRSRRESHRPALRLEAPVSFGGFSMPRVRDWIRLRPILKPYKSFRRRRIGAAYLRRPAPDEAQLRNAKIACHGRPIILTIAYSSAWALKWQLLFSKFNMKSDAVRLIADNSPDDVSAAEIERLCGMFGATYVRLPFNQFSLGRPKDASLSHAVALNWVWRNIIRPAAPTWCAILDHDMIPIYQVNLQSKLANQPFFGAAVNGTYGGWQLWPGLAVFSGTLVKDFEFDFWPDALHNLDTGGSNYHLIFSRYERDKFDLLNFEKAPVGKFSEWWHLGNASAYNPHNAGWQERVEEDLSKAIEYKGFGSAQQELH